MSSVYTALTFLSQWETWLWVSECSCTVIASRPLHSHSFLLLTRVLAKNFSSSLGNFSPNNLNHYPTTWTRRLNLFIKRNVWLLLLRTFTGIKKYREYGCSVQVTALKGGLNGQLLFRQAHKIKNNFNLESGLNRPYATKVSRLHPELAGAACVRTFG